MAVDFGNSKHLVSDPDSQSSFLDGIGAEEGVLMMHETRKASSELACPKRHHFRPFK